MGGAVHARSAKTKITHVNFDWWKSGDAILNVCASKPVTNFK